jgi:hypothetical protein
MVADSAITFTEVLPSGEEVPRVLNGVCKLQRIPYLGAGISMWGLGSIPVGNSLVSTDIWLADFIQQNSHISSLAEFAVLLGIALQKIVGGRPEPLGFHLAGYVEMEGRRLPTFYHVRNVDGNYRDGYKHHEFVPGQDFPPREISDDIYTTRNGDYGPYAILSGLTRHALKAIKNEIDLTIPYPSLEKRIAYHVTWVKFVSELYASAGRLRTIGGTVAALGISPDGQITCSPNL